MKKIFAGVLVAAALVATPQAVHAALIDDIANWFGSITGQSPASSVVISGVSATAGSPIISNNTVIAQPVTFTYTLTAGNDTLYIPSNPKTNLGFIVSGFTPTSRYPFEMAYYGGPTTIVTNPGTISGDTSPSLPTGYFVIPAGSSRTFTYNGMVRTSDVMQDGIQTLTISGITYGKTPNIYSIGANFSTQKIVTNLPAAPATPKLTLTLDAASPLKSLIQISPIAQTNNVILGKFDIKSPVNGTLQSLDLQFHTNRAHISDLFARATLTINGLTYAADVVDIGNNNGFDGIAKFSNMSTVLPAGQTIVLTFLGDIKKDTGGTLTGGQASTSINVTSMPQTVNANPVVVDASGATILVTPSYPTTSDLTFSSGSGIVSNVSGVAGTPIISNNTVIAQPVSFKFTVTAGNNTLYLASNPTKTLGVVVSGFSVPSPFPFDMAFYGGPGTVSANPNTIAGDTSISLPTGYYVIPAGSSRTFTISGVVKTKDAIQDGFQSLTLSSIMYAVAPDIYDQKGILSPVKIVTNLPSGSTTGSGAVSVTLDSSSPLQGIVQISKSAQTDNVTLAKFDIKSQGVAGSLRALKVNLGITGATAQSLFGDVKLNINGQTYSADTITNTQATFTNLNIALTADQNVVARVLGRINQDTGNLSGSSVRVSIAAQGTTNGAANNPVVVDPTTGGTVTTYDVIENVPNGNNIFFSSGSGIVSNVSGTAGSPIISNNVAVAQNVNYKFTLTAGADTLYVSADPLKTLGVVLTGFSPSSEFPFSNKLFSADPTSLPGDSAGGFPSDYFVVPAGSSRTFGFGGVVKSANVIQDGFQTLTLSNIKYGVKANIFDQSAITSPTKIVTNLPSGSTTGGGVVITGNPATMSGDTTTTFVLPPGTTRVFTIKNNSNDQFNFVRIGSDTLTETIDPATQAGDQNNFVYVVPPGGTRTVTLKNSANDAVSVTKDRLDYYVQKAGTFTTSAPTSGDSWKIGDNRTIVWTYPNELVGKNVALYVNLSDGDKSWNIFGTSKLGVANSVPAGGQVAWSLLKNDGTITSGKYHIDVLVTDLASRKYYDGVSPTFSVDASGGAITPTSNVKVLSPNGGEVLKQLQLNVISWTGGKGSVQIGVVDATPGKENFPIGWIKLNGAPNGTAVWNGYTLTDLSGTSVFELKSVSAGPYKIVVVSQDDLGNYCVKSTTNGTSCNSDLSDGSFTVSSGDAAPIITSIQPGSAPAGYLVTITGSNLLFAGSASRTYVSISSGGKDTGTYASSIAFDGKTLNFIVPNLPAGNYTLNLVGPALLQSNYLPFSIANASSSITVLSPNGGESLKIGSPYTITWSSKGLPTSAKISITLFNGDLNTSLVGNLPSTQTSYTWIATEKGDWGLGDAAQATLAKLTGANVARADGNNYKVLVSASWDNYRGNAYDYSDKPFSILSGDTGGGTNGGVTVNAKLLTTSDDHAGSWGVFAPGVGNVNKDKADWNWVTVFYPVTVAKSVKRITVVSDTKGEIWSTGYSRYLADGTDLYGYNEHPYPLVISVGKTPSVLNKTYDQDLNMPIGVGTSGDYELFGQRESTSFKGGTLIVEFTDGTSVKTRIDASVVPVTSPVNGSCGVRPDSCSVGTFVDQADSSSQNLWMCSGASGGTTASCSAPVRVDTPSINVVYPNGGETLSTTNGTINVVYQGQNLKNEIHVYLTNISTGDVFQGTDLTSFNLGSGKWTSLAPLSGTKLLQPITTGKYRVTVCDVKTDSNITPGKPLCDSSDDYFTIAAPVATPTVTATPTPTPSTTASPSPTATYSPSSTPNPTNEVPLGATCFASPSNPVIGQMVYWYVSTSGGATPFSYSWSGGDVIGSSSNASHAYSTSGVKSTTVRVTTPKQSVLATCNVTVSIPTPTYSSTPTPTPIPTPTVTGTVSPSPSSTNTSTTNTNTTQSTSPSPSSTSSASPTSSGHVSYSSPGIVAAVFYALGDLFDSVLK